MQDPVRIFAHTFFPFFHSILFRKNGLLSFCSVSFGEVGVIFGDFRSNLQCSKNVRVRIPDLAQGNVLFRYENKQCTFRYRMLNYPKKTTCVEHVAPLTTRVALRDVVSKLMAVMPINRPFMLSVRDLTEMVNPMDSNLEILVESFMPEVSPMFVEAIASFNVSVYESQYVIDALTIALSRLAPTGTV